jgi:hypothetical protein
MKPKKLLRWVVLASVGTVAVACGGGITPLGSGDEPGMGQSGSMSTTGGSTSQTTAGKGGSMSSAGNEPGVAGTGAQPGTESCMVDEDCVDYGAPCEPCADGSFACNKTYCAAGKCVHTRDTCSIKCESDMDCPQRDALLCKPCGDGTSACETTQCIMGQCQTSYQGCGGYDPCKGVACGAPCKACGPDGMDCDTALTYCDAGGNCTASFPHCMDPGECKTAMDCGPAPPDCKPCGDGQCAQFDCVENKCVFGCQPDPEPECKTTDDCLPTDAVCKLCPATMNCAVPFCWQGSCELVCPLE